jgi:hypothetical protein
MPAVSVKEEGLGQELGFFNENRREVLAVETRRCVHTFRTLDVISRIA